MKRFMLLTSAIIGLAASVSAAQAQDHRGFYVGVHGGWDIQPGDKGEGLQFDTNLDGNYDNFVNTAAGANAFSPGFCGGRANNATAAGGCKTEKDGGELGVRLGYDWQWDQIVLGAVGELNWHNMNDSVSGFSTTPASYTMTRELNWSGAIRARAGLAVNKALIYGTAGWVRGDVDHAFTTTNGVNTFTTRDGKNLSGYQVGGGLEWGVSPGWSVGAEYLYSNLSDSKYRVRAAGPAPATNPFILANASGTDIRRSDSDFDYGALRLTLTYRFGS